MNLFENFKIVQGLSPVTTNGGVTADYVSLKNAKKATIVVNLTQAVGDATTLTVNKATAVDGTGATAITVAQPILANEDVGASDTLVKQTDGVGYTVAADVKNKQVVIEIDPASLGEGFDVITLVVGDSGQATNFVSVDYYLEAKYAQATPPSAIVD